MKEIKFTKGNWESFFERSYSRRFPFKPEFAQEADCIANKRNAGMRDGFDYTTIVTKEKYAAGTQMWFECLFENYGAPLLTFTDKLARDEEGILSYGACYEVVLWEKGINVWDLYEEDGAIKVHKLLSIDFNLETNKKHELYVKLGEKSITMAIGDKKADLRIENLPKEVYIGLTGCEDINRIYSFKLDNEETGKYKRG